jgi:hypothetical protein
MVPGDCVTSVLAVTATPFNVSFVTTFITVVGVVDVATVVIHQH